MPQEKWVGFFGGSFNPPHLGHLLASVYALKRFELDEVWLAPAYRHRFEKDLAPYADRVKMCQLLVEGFRSRLKVSTFEGDRKTDGKTLNTLLALREKYPRHHFSLLIGSDLLKETKKWYRFREIENRFSVLVVPRGGASDRRIAIPDISSSEIRRRRKNERALGELVTPDVAAYILEKGLYATTRSIQPPPRTSSSR
jgi:nicotinate-nucleotide adenylyltransferase